MARTSPSELESTPIQHHPLVRACRPVTTTGPPEFHLGFLGVRTRRIFTDDMMNAAERLAAAALESEPYPQFDNEYFEWIDVLESVEEARDTFVMIELGAGYGRWSVRAALAVRQKSSCEFRCTAIEAEPDHFRWLRQHFQDNDMNPSDHELIWAAVGAQPGWVPFWVGRAREWYGQAIARRAETPMPDARTRQRLRARSALGRPPVFSSGEATVTWIPSISLSDVLASYPRVDLIDIDIQGAELAVLASSIELVTRRVRRLHIGTHSPAIEDGLRTLFIAQGWQNLNDFRCGSRVTTPYGEMEFGDGVQTWLNPLLAPGEPPVAARPPGSNGPGPSAKSLRQLEQATSRLKDLKSKNARLLERCRSLEAKLQSIRESHDRSTTMPTWRSWFSRRRDR
jgi:FkbM family methyltransferase